MSRAGRSVRGPALAFAAILVAACDPGPAVIRVELRDAGGGVPRGAAASLASASTDDVLAYDTVRASGNLEWTVATEGAGWAAFAPRPGPGSDWTHVRLPFVPGTRTTLRVTVPDSGAPVVAFSDPRGIHARWDGILASVNAMRTRHYDAFRSWVAEGGQGAFEYDWGRAPDSVVAAIAAEDRTVVREALLYQLGALGSLGAELEPETWDRVLAGIRPSSPVWSAGRPPSEIAGIALRAQAAGGGEDMGGVAAGPGGMGDAGDVGATGDVGGDPEAVAGRRALAWRRAAEYFRRGAEEHPDPAVRAAMLHGGMLAAMELGETDRARALFERLATEYPESRAYETARMEAPGAAVAEGDTIPPLWFPPLDTAGAPIRPDRLLGRTVLIDFWAVWCTPCVAEMPTLHTAHDRFGDRGFEILSVSFDEDPETVQAFREDRWPMPWRHSFVGLDSLGSGELAAAYGVTGLPRAVLVGPDLTVLAIDAGLRGEALETTLEELLGEPATRADSVAVARAVAGALDASPIATEGPPGAEAVPGPTVEIGPPLFSGDVATIAVTVTSGSKRDPDRVYFRTRWYRVHRVDGRWGEPELVGEEFALGTALGTES